MGMRRCPLAPTLSSLYPTYQATASPPSAPPDRRHLRIPSIIHLDALEGFRLVLPLWCHSASVNEKTKNTLPVSTIIKLWQRALFPVKFMCYVPLAIYCRVLIFYASMHVERKKFRVGVVSMVRKPILTPMFNSR